MATCLPVDLEEILYELVPRKVMIPSDDADGIIDDCTAFYTFLKRVYKHSIADECLGILNHSAKKKLRDALSDASKFGVGKSVISGNDFPIDSTPYMELLAQMESPGGVGLGHTVVKPTKAQKSNQKKKRKAAQKSRKKNRR